jgi:hypothetical protein
MMRVPVTWFTMQIDVLLELRLSQHPCRICSWLNVFLPELPKKLTLWVAQCHQPFVIIEDEELVNIFKELNNKVEVPLQKTVSCNVKEIFDISRAKVAEILQVG